MSNIIPIVSSSPPPLEDGPSCGWDDDDDDFGNFASAPAFGHPPSDDGHDGGFDVDWSQANSDTSAPASKESSPAKEVTVPSSQPGKAAEQVAATSSTENDTGVENGSDDEFAGFATFQDDTQNKPSVGSLPLQSTNQSVETDSQTATSETASSQNIQRSRESTTDSGLFSSDLSPVPKSDSTSECDRVMQSEDESNETFADLPQDGAQSGEGSVSGDDGKTAIAEEEGTLDETESGCPTPYNQQEQNSPVSFPAVGNVCDENSGTGSGDSQEQRVGPKQDLQVADTGIINTGSEGVPSESGTKHFSASCDVESQDLSGASGAEHHLPRKDVGDEDVDGEADVTNGQSDEDWAGFEAFGDKNTAEPEALQLGVQGEETHQKEVESISNVLGGTESSGGDNTDTEPENMHSSQTPLSTTASEGTDIEQKHSKTDSGDSVQSDTVSLENKDESRDVSSQNAAVEESTDTAEDSQSHQMSNSQSDDDADDNFGDFSGQPASSVQKLSDVGDIPTESPDDDDFGDFSQHPASSTQKLSGSDGISPETLDDDVGDFSQQPTSSVQKPSDATDVPTKTHNEDDFGDFNGQPAETEQKLPEAEKASSEPHGDNDDFGDFSSQPDKSVPTETETEEPGIKDSEFFSSVKEDQEDEDEFGHFSERSMPDELCLKKPSSDDFAAFPSETPEEDDDFGDFSSLSAPVPSGDADDFGAFSEGGVKAASGEDDDFGDFSSQKAAGSAGDDTGWAAFGDSAGTDSAEDDDFGDFSEQSGSAQTVTATFSSAEQSSHATQGNKVEKVLSSCFPELSQTSPPKQGKAPEDTENEDNGEDLQGTLGTILKFGMRFRSASQQTWQVVEHPSKKDPRVKLWHRLEDVDGSPAVVYQWLKSAGNSHLFKTLHIDTQNMLIGLKKPAVPVFATGLSLLEPIRGGSRDRNDRSQPPKQPANNLVDHSQRENTDKQMQDIPAVDFDWSSSGLTNPLTSKSLDLDFLVVQENDSPEKLSVFESELLDAPRSNVKPLQPLEDILKNAKPTSVRSRRNDSAASEMSEEASRVLASLPDLTFMHSKVLMFPIKN